MAAMEQRVPDEYFRRAAESDDVRADDAPRGLPATAAVKAVAPTDVRDGWTPRAVASLAVVLLGVAFTIGRLWVFPPDVPTGPAPTPSPSAPRSASATPSTALAPFDGPVTAVRAIDAEGRCLEGGSREAPLALVDNNADTLWRCRGEGVGESVTIRFPGARAVVGLRVVNGNTVWTDRYLAERRITAIRWTFADGSFFEQGLAANDRTAQEVRFPEVTTDTVTLTVLHTTPPGGSGTSVDAVSIGSLEFLAPA